MARVTVVATALALVVLYVGATASAQTLYAGGSFSRFGDVLAYSAAQWDGLRWSRLDSGVAGGAETVYAIVPYSTNSLMLAGSFKRAGGLPVNSIARWDLSNGAWSALGDGLTYVTTTGVVDAATVYALATTDVGQFGQRLVYACGTFTTAGDSRAYYVAAWDGGRWSSVAAPNNNYNCRSMVAHNGIVFVVYSGGSATVWSWDNYVWTTLSGFDGTPLSLGIYQNELVVATYIPTGTPGYIYRRTNLSWSLLGQMDTGLVYAFSEHDGALIAAGSFSSIDGVQAAKIASWNGTAWSALGSGIDGDGLPYALATYAGKLVVGGNYKTVEGIAAGGLATWDGSAWFPVGSGVNFGTVYSLLVA